MVTKLFAAAAGGGDAAVLDSAAADAGGTDLLLAGAEDFSITDACAVTVRGSISIAAASMVAEPALRANENAAPRAAFCHGNTKTRDADIGVRIVIIY
jgi:hypothetical protein